MNLAKNWKDKSNKTSFSFQHPGRTYSKLNCHIKEKKKPQAKAEINKNPFLFFPCNTDYTSYLFKSSSHSTDKYTL